VEEDLIREIGRSSSSRSSDDPDAPKQQEKQLDARIFCLNSMSVSLPVRVVLPLGIFFFFCFMGLFSGGFARKVRKEEWNGNYEKSGGVFIRGAK
jgi:hypothetical protein